MNIEQKPESAKDRDDMEAELRNIETIPEKDRKLESLGDYGYRWRVRNLSSEKDPEPAGSNRFTEYFFDFDDTLFDTNGYVRAVFDELEKIGIPVESSREVYRTLKIFRPEEFTQKLVDVFPDKRDLIEEAFLVPNPHDFVKPETSQLIKELSVVEMAKVHILTRGDRDFQLKKIKEVFDQLGVPIDVLITESSKAEFLRKFLEEEYPNLFDSDFMPSFVVIDDKPEEIEQLLKLKADLPSLLPVRLKDPFGKYSDKDVKGEQSYEMTSREIRDILSN